MKKADFMQIRGYDEAIKGYGFEDNDIKNRLLNLGRTQIGFEQKEFLEAISHSEEERIKNEFTYNHLQALFVEKINYQQAKIIFIYKDLTYESAIIADNIYTQFENQDYFVKPLEVLNRYFIVEKNIEKGIFNAELTKNAHLIEKKETIILYYEASTYVNAKDYDTALKLYEELKGLNYSGKATYYYAVNKVNSQEDFFNNAVDRDRMVKMGTHEKPRTENVPSKRGEIYKNVALIYVQQGKMDLAKKAVSDARKANPDDAPLKFN